MKQNLVYCYDAYCGWCYGFRPVMQQVAAQYADRFYITVLSGGMILPQKPMPVGVVAAHIRDAYKNVETATGVAFGADYLWHIYHPEQSDWFPDSRKPAIALSVIKTYFPDKALSFASDLQYALHYEGRDLTDDEAYRHLLPAYGMTAGQFYRDLADPAFFKKAEEDFMLVQRLRVTGFPAVFIQGEGQKFYQVGNGYVPFEVLKERLDAVPEA